MTRDPATAYASAVVAKRIVAGPHVRAACARHLRDIKTAKKRGIEWRPKAAALVYDFFREVLLLAGKVPFELQPWQQFIVGSLFGWYRKDGSRRFRVAYIETAKGQGKTPLAAGIGLATLLIDEEVEPEVYSAAVTRDQAKLVFECAKSMVEDSETLAEAVRVLTNALHVEETRGFFRPLSAEHQGLDGKRPHCALVDELHEHRTAHVLDKLRLGTKGRRNPLIIAITNAGFDRQSVCWREHEYAVRVVDGTTENDSFFSYVCALDKGDDFRDRRVWIKTNPNLGVSVVERYLQELIVEAEGQPTKLNIILRLNFCVWTESHTVWIPAATWDENQGTAHWKQIARINKGRPAWLGLDLAATNDFCAAIVVIPDETDGEAYDIVCRFWICEKAFKARVKLGREPYQAWRDEGALVVTPGDATDYDFIEAELLELAEHFDLREVVYDRYWASQLVSHLQTELGDERVVQFGQGFLSMSAPVNEIERLAARRKLRHGGHPVMKWQVANVQIRIDPAGNKKIDKAKSSDKVDGPVSLAEAIGRAMVRHESPEDPEDTTYDDREVRFL